MRTQARKTASGGRKGPKKGSRARPGGAYVAKLETRLERWGARLDDLVAKAEEAGAEARSDYRNRIVELKAKYEVARSKVDEARAAGSDRWDAFRARVERAWTELEASFKRLRTARPPRRVRPGTVTARRAVPRRRASRSRDRR